MMKAFESKEKYIEKNWDKLSGGKDFVTTQSYWKFMKSAKAKSLTRKLTLPFLPSMIKLAKRKKINGKGCKDFKPKEAREK